MGTRHEAIRLRGWATCWVVIWYNSQADYLRHTDFLGIRSKARSPRPAWMRAAGQRFSS